MKNDIITLLHIDNRPLGEEIQRILENENIYSLLESENPASSFISTSMGANSFYESMQIKVTSADYEKAHKLISKSAYKELLVEE